MQLTSPQIYLVARPSLNWSHDGLDAYLEDIGADQYIEAAMRRVETTDAEEIVAAAGKLCYRSWQPDLNANISKVREDLGDYLRNIIESGHGAVLEHVNWSFIFHNVSRVFTHELVRHRAGVAISQESLRYVALTDLNFYLPPELEPHADRVVSIVENLEEIQRDMREATGIDGPVGGDESIPFAEKKKIQSALRRLAPIGLGTSIMWTANARTLRHVIELRTSRHAEQEIRVVFDEVAGMMQHEAPLLFGDFERTLVDGVDEWVPKASKV